MCLAVFLCDAFAQSAQPLTRQGQTHTATIVVILDDLGNNLELGQRAIKLPGAINYAILPQSPNASLLARAAHQHGKEIILHMPMSNIRGHRTDPGTLTAAMDKDQFIATLRQNLAAIPHVRGVNNHMGSLLTQLRQPMSWFIQELKRQQLYFIDSRTSPLTVAESLARSHGLPHLRRHVFLDNQRTKQAIAAQFAHLLSLARARGVAVAIGHPHPETLDFLEQTLPTLGSEGIQLAFASEVINQTVSHCLYNSLSTHSPGTHCASTSSFGAISD